MAIFDRSWYGRVLVEKVDKIVKRKVWSKAYDEIRSFERQLSDDRNVIVKFFLHISQKEQRRRFRKLQSNLSTAWKVTEEDWKHHRQYDKYLEAIEEMLAQTDTDFAPWTIVEAHDRRFATVNVFKTVIEAIERGIHRTKHPGREHHGVGGLSIQPANMCPSILDKTDLSLSLTRSEYEEALKKYQQRIRELEHEVYLKRLPVIIVYEGWDAAGKGGNIKRVCIKSREF